MPETEITPVDRRTRIASHLAAYDGASRPVRNFKDGTTKFLFSVGYNPHAGKITYPERTSKATLAEAREALLQHLTPVLEMISSPEYAEVREDLSDAIAALDPYLPVENGGGESVQEVVRLDAVDDERTALASVYRRIREQSDKVTSLVKRDIARKGIAEVWQGEELDSYTKMALQVRIEAGEDATGTVEEIETAVEGMKLIDEQLRNSNGEPILVKYRHDRRASYTDGLGLMIEEDAANPPSRVLSLGPRAVKEYTDLHTPGYPIVYDVIPQLTLPHGALRLLTRDRTRDILIGKDAIRGHLQRNPSDESHIKALFEQLNPQNKAIEGNSRRQITS